MLILPILGTKNKGQRSCSHTRFGCHKRCQGNFVVLTSFMIFKTKISHFFAFVFFQLSHASGKKNKKSRRRDLKAI